MYWSVQHLTVMMPWSAQVSMHHHDEFNVQKMSNFFTDEIIDRHSAVIVFQTVWRLFFLP